MICTEPLVSGNQEKTGSIFLNAIDFCEDLVNRVMMQGKQRASTKPSVQHFAQKSSKMLHNNLLIDILSLLMCTK